jgi:hypothetical protein
VSERLVTVSARVRSLSCVDIQAERCCENLVTFSADMRQVSMGLLDAY